MSKLRNVNLDVANFAMSCVEEAKEDKDYKSLVKKMPTLIQKNGFIATLVFNLSKVNKMHHKKVLINIIEWNEQNCKINKFLSKNIISDKDKEMIKEYIEWVTNLEPVQYRLITKEMMNLFGWIKRFADGMIDN
ncbi:type III-B CRISPR module-associated protein Cmr5 [Clostridium ihumii]|uniref:type III-B CRISPR module-associated protein Cmr5 n=1 Tax=Clostridium ihumii TaxID=1470356 RepID=UPI003D3360F8